VDKNFPRLLDTLQLIPAQGKISTPEIKRRLADRGHNTTARTVQRDLEDLALAFGLDCDIRSKPYGWSWRKAPKRLSLPGMDWPEALSFHLLQRYLHDVIPASVQDALRPYFDQADERLNEHFRDAPLKRWPQRVRVVPAGAPLLSPKISARVHATVTEALLAGFQLRLRYRPPQSVPQAPAWEHDVSPLGLVQHGALLYLVVRFYDYDDVRMLALHRVQTATMLDTAVSSARFDLDDWISVGALGYGGRDLIDIALRFRNGAGDHVLESPLDKDQAADSGIDGSLTIRARVIDTERLRRWLLGFGPDVEVLKPIALRQTIAQRLNAAATTYSKHN